MNIADLHINTAGRFGRFLLLGILGAVLFFIVLNPLSRSGFGVTSDEGYYYHYAVHIQENGGRGFNELTQWYARNIEAKNHPAPVRIGYITTCAFIFDHLGADYVWMGMLSIVFFLSFLALNFFYLRRHFGYDLALMTVVLLGTSPLLLGLSRRALVDGPVNFFWAVLLWAMFEVFVVGVSRWRLCLIVISLAVALLFKESSVLLAAVILVLGVISSLAYRRWNILMSVLFAVLAAILLYLGIMVLAFGGFQGVWEGWAGLLATHTSLSSNNPYALYYSSGPWFRYLLDFFLLSPVSFLLAAGFLFYFFVGEKKDRSVSYWLGVFLLIYFLFDLPAHSKVVRMVSILELPLAFFTVKAVEIICSRRNWALKSISSYTWVALLAVLNFSFFLKIFYIPGLLDPISYHLLVIQGFIPPRGI